MTNASPRQQATERKTTAEGALYAARKKLYVRAVNGIFNN